MPEQLPNQTEQGAAGTPSGGPETPQEASENTKDAFKKRILNDIKNLKKSDEALNELREKTRGEIKTIPMPFMRPWLIVGMYCLLVFIGSYFFLVVPTVIVMLLLKLIFGIPWFFVGIGALAPIVPAILMIGVFILLQFDNLFVIVASGKGGVRRYWNTPVHKTVDDKPNYEPIHAGLVCAPRPFWEVDQLSLAPKTFDIDEHTITVQRMQEMGETDEEALKRDPEAATIDEAGADKLRSTIEWSGKFTIEPDSSDFRSLIILSGDYIGGIDKAGARNKESLVRGVQRFCASPEGPLNQPEALAMGEFMQEAIETFIQEDLIETGTRLQTINPNIKLPKVQIDAIQAANKEGADKVREETQAMTFARSRAIAMTGKTEITAEDVEQILKDNPADPDVIAFLTARANNTIGPESPFPYKKIDTNSKTLDLVEVIKEVTSG